MADFTQPEVQVGGLPGELITVERGELGELIGEDFGDVGGIWQSRSSLPDYPVARSTTSGTTARITHPATAIASPGVGWLIDRTSVGPT